MAQQFPFTLRQLHDTTQDELQNELYAREKAQDVANRVPPPKGMPHIHVTRKYTSGEVITLYEEAHARALIRLAEGSYPEAVVQTFAKELEAQDIRVRKARETEKRRRAAIRGKRGKK